MDTTAAYSLIKGIFRLLETTEPELVMPGIAIPVGYFTENQFVNGILKITHDLKTAELILLVPSAQEVLSRRIELFLPTQLFGTKAAYVGELDPQ